MKKTIRLHLFSFYDNSKFERHLEKMAAKGWLLDKIYGFIHVYKRIEPAKLKFSVQYLYQGSAYLSSDEEAVLEYREVLEEAGWTFLADSGEVQVFYSEEENPVPIDTEPEVEYRSIVKSFLRNVLPLILLIFLYSFFMLKSRDDYLEYFPLEYFSNSSRLILDGIFISGMVFSAIEIFLFLIWKSLTKKSLSTGSGLVSIKPMKYFEIIVAVIIIMALIFTSLMMHDVKTRNYLLLTFIYFLAISLLYELIRNKLPMGDRNKKLKRFAIFAIIVFYIFIYKVSMAPEEVEGESRFVGLNGEIVTVYKDEIPLKIEDFVEINDRLYSYRLFDLESPVVRRISGRQNSIEGLGTEERESLSYHVNKIKWKFLYDYLLKKELDANSISPEDLVTDPSYKDMKVYRKIWGYKNHMHKFVISKDDYITTIEFSFEPSPEELVNSVDTLIKTIESK